MELSLINALLVGVVIYGVVVLALGLAGLKARESFRDFVTAGASAGAWICAFSLISTIIGSSATIGIGKLALANGAGAFWWIGVGVIGLIIHGWLIAPKIREMQALTLPHVVEMMAGKTAARLSGLIIVVSWIAIVAAQFVALKAILLSLFPHSQWGEWLYFALVAVILIHTSLAGQRGVLFTDFIQTVLLIGGFGAAGFWLLTLAPERLDGVSLMPFNATFGFSQWIQLLCLVGFAYVVGPDMFSRSLSAKSGLEARKAAWIAAPILLAFGVIITLLALGNLGTSSPIAAWLSESSPMGIGLKVILAIGLVSALSGSVDTVLFSSGAILEHTVLGARSVGRLRIEVAVIGILGVIIAQYYPNIIGLLLSAYAFFVPGVAVPLFIVLLGRGRVHALGWIVASMVGGLLGLSKLWIHGPIASWMPIIGMFASAVIVAYAMIYKTLESDDSDDYML